MDSSIKQDEIVKNRLDCFLKTNTEFQYKKLFVDHRFFDTYEIKKKFEGKKRKITVLKMKRDNGKKQYRILTTRCYDNLLKNINNPIKTEENGFKPYEMNLPINKLLVWLKDPENELLWFPEN